MSTNTRRRTTFAILAIVVATTALTLLTWNTFTSPVSALKAHHSLKASDSTGSPSAGSSGSGSGGSSTNKPPKSGDNTNLNNLIACESTAANGSGHITQKEVLNCYSQTYSGSPVSPLLTAGDNTSSNSDTHSGSVSTHQSGTPSSHGHTHHHHSSSSSSLPSAATSSSNGL